MALGRHQKLEIERVIKERRATIASDLEKDVEKCRQEPYAELRGTPASDIGDEASADLLSDLEQAELSRDADELQALDAALARLSGGNYGTCIDCGEGIAFERLVAHPAALRCFDCQRIREKTFAQPSRAKL